MGNKDQQPVSISGFIFESYILKTPKGDLPSTYEYFYRTKHTDLTPEQYKEIKEKIVEFLKWFKKNDLLEVSNMPDVFEENPALVKYYGYDRNGKGKIKNIEDNQIEDDVISINDDKVKRKRGRKPKEESKKRKTTGTTKKVNKGKTKAKVGRPKKKEGDVPKMKLKTVKRGLTT